MIWRDLVVPSWCTNQQIASALSAALGVDASNVVMSDSIADLRDAAPFCLRSDVAAGTFGSVLSIYLAFEPPNDDAVIATFAQSLDKRVLTSDDESADPYEMRLFAPGSAPQTVRMLESELDEGRHSIAATRGISAELPASRPPPVVAPGRCPVDGYWVTPAKPGSRRRFAKGDPMPDLGSAYGTTIWQWDDRQSD